MHECKRKREEKKRSGRQPTSGQKTRNPILSNAVFGFVSLLCRFDVLIHYFFPFVSASFGVICRVIFRFVGIGSSSGFDFGCDSAFGVKRIHWFDIEFSAGRSDFAVVTSQRDPTVSCGTDKSERNVIQSLLFFRKSSNERKKYEYFLIYLFIWYFCSFHFMFLFSLARLRPSWTCEATHQKLCSHMERFDRIFVLFLFGQCWTCSTILNYLYPISLRCAAPRNDWMR